MVWSGRTSWLDESWSSWVGQRPHTGTDMKIWQTTRTIYKVSDFISWQREKSLELSPWFQRKSVWKTGAKSYLIDTIMRGLPIPILFLRDLPTDLQTFKPRREVVDGQQRIRTLVSYIAPESLADLDPTRDVFRIKAAHNKDYANHSFKDLPGKIQQHILDYQFSVHVFPSDTDDREILQIFSRMNSTGVKLNAQELRNAEFFGEFKTVALNLAAEQLERWREWKIFTADQLARMEEIETTSELMVVILKGIDAKTQPAITAPYRQYDESFPTSAIVEKRFRTIFDTIENHLLQEVVTLYSKRTLFYALFAAVYDIQYGLLSPLDKSKPASLTALNVAQIRRAGEYIRTKNAPPQVMAATTRRTTNIGERKTLARFIAGPRP